MAHADQIGLAHIEPTAQQGQGCACTAATEGAAEAGGAATRAFQQFEHGVVRTHRGDVDLGERGGGHEAHPDILIGGGPDGLRTARLGRCRAKAAHQGIRAGRGHRERDRARAEVPGDGCVRPSERPGVPCVHAPRIVPLEIIGRTGFQVDVQVRVERRGNAAIVIRGVQCEAATGAGMHRHTRIVVGVRGLCAGAQVVHAGRGRGICPPTRRGGRRVVLADERVGSPARAIGVGIVRVGVHADVRGEGRGTRTSAAGEICSRDRRIARGLALVREREADHLTVVVRPEHIVAQGIGHLRCA